MLQLHQQSRKVSLIHNVFIVFFHFFKTQLFYTPMCFLYKKNITFAALLKIIKLTLIKSLNKQKNHEKIFTYVVGCFDNASICTR